MKVRIVLTEKGYELQQKNFFFWRTLFGPYHERQSAMIMLDALRKTKIHVTEV